MKLLLLGGTADARRLAKMLHSAAVEIVYSVAGFVRTPDVECAIISGGFSQLIDRGLKVCRAALQKPVRLCCPRWHWKSGLLMDRKGQFIGFANEHY